jgi:hypothetical protein
MSNNILNLPCAVTATRIGEDKKSLILPCPVGAVNDGDHSFDELYEHRNLLFIAFLNLVNNGWYSEQHHDGSRFDGWFIAGVELMEGEQITYHLPNKFLDLVSLNLKHLEYAPEWDGHTAAGVLERLQSWIESGCYLLPIA